MDHPQPLMHGGWLSAILAACYSFADWLVTDSSGHMSGLGILAGVGAVLVVAVKLVEASFRALSAWRAWKLERSRRSGSFPPRSRSEEDD